MKEALLRGQALKTETLSDKLSMIGQMSEFGYSADFKAENAERIAAMTLEDVKRLAKDYLRTDAIKSGKPNEYIFEKNFGNRPARKRVTFVASLWLSHRQHVDCIPNTPSI